MGFGRRGVRAVASGQVEAGVEELVGTAACEVVVAQPEMAVPLRHLLTGFLAGADFLPAAGAAVGLQDFFTEADGFGGDFHESVRGARGGCGTGEVMGRAIASADRQSQHHRASCSEAIALVCGAFALTVGAAAWIADPAQTALLSAYAPFGNAGPSSFDERFLPPPPAESLAPHYSSSMLDRFVFARTDMRVLEARELLARQLQSPELFLAAIEGFLKEA